MEKITYEIAQKEIETWMDARRVSQSKRKNNESGVETLIEAVMYGQIVINEDTNQITQNLAYPLGEDESVKTLVYKSRITQKEVQDRVSSLKSQDSLSIISAYISALTLQPIAVLGKLDSTDYSLCQAIAVFFI